MKFRIGILVGCLLLVSTKALRELQTPDFKLDQTSDFTTDNEESVDKLENLDNFDEEKFVDENVMPNDAEDGQESDDGDLKEADNLQDFEEEVNPVIRNIGAPIRLVNGGAPNRGRVEIYHNGTWGTVCDDYWDINDANVVCRQLGLPPAISAPCCARFGRGSGRTWMDDLRCSGRERYLSQCRFRGWGIEDCSHSEDAGVVCGSLVTPTPSLSSITRPAAVTSEPVLPSTSIYPSASSTYMPPIASSALPGAPIRLVNGGSPNQGRVEVYHNGRWGTVCDDYWDINDANVVCRQLGLPPATSSPCCARFGRGIEPTWMDNVQCNGSERYLSQCRFRGWGIEDCSHSEDAGVVCGRPSCGNSTTCYNGGTPYCQGGRSYCRCPSGFTGRQCRTAVCRNIPCYNGGSRYCRGGQAYCRCRPGYTGQYCQTGVCRNIYCYNGGSRYCRGGQAYCRCRPGYTGRYCQTGVCRNIYCYNGGSRYCRGGQAYCRCRPGYTGRYCQTAVCRPIYCRNGGTSYCRGGQAYCRCRPGYSGRYCQSAVCGWIRCYNGGSRFCRGGRPYCRCRFGYTGRQCRYSIRTTRRPWSTTRRPYPTRHPRLDILRILLKMLKGITTLLDGIKDGIRAGISRAGARQYKREVSSMLGQLDEKADAIKDSSDEREMNLLKDLGQVRERAHVLMKQLDEVPEDKQEQ